MKNNKIDTTDCSNRQIFALTFLRIAIGWHFLYEGLSKLSIPGWTAKGYLLGSVGPISPILKGMAHSGSIMKVVDMMNEWGLVLIGLSLFLGLLSKPAKICGILLLSFYYLAYPPFASLGINTHVEGNYWVVNKNLIEMAALLVLLMSPTSRITGIDKFIPVKYQWIASWIKHENR
jgi:thiosulfate dehydrogenase (quinone) large subunit